MEWFHHIGFVEMIDVNVDVGKRDTSILMFKFLQIVGLNALREDKVQVLGFWSILIFI